MTDVLEAEVRELEDDEPTPQRAVAVVSSAPQQLAHSHFTGMASLAAMSDDAFEAGIRAMKLELSRIERIQRELLDEGTDYGTVQGVKRPFLHKPGAEKLSKFAGYAITFRVDRLVGDGEHLPPLAFVVHADVHMGDSTGPIIAEGVGEANSWETKYRWRTGGRVCPSCGNATIIEIRPKQADIEKAEREGKPEPKKRFWCAPREGGCRAGFAGDDPRVAEQTSGRVENADPFDLANTLVKMGKKRAFVDGVLTATGTSGLFTQDEDSPLAAGGVAGENRERTSGSEQEEDGQVRPMGAYEAVGTIKLGSGPSTDGTLRETDEGPMLGFQLDRGGGSGIAQVIAGAGIAEPLLVVTNNALAGVKVTVAGDLFSVPHIVGGAVVKRYQQLRLRAIWNDEWRIPAMGFDELADLEGAPPAPDPAVPSAGSGDPTTSAAEPETPVAAQDAVNPVVATAPLLPLDLPAFYAALEAERISEAYAVGLMNRDFPKATSFADLSDDERGQLLASARE